MKAAKPRKVKIAEIVMDYDIYPRSETDPYHVNSMLEAMAAGVEMPPIVIDAKSKRIVDGFHRFKAQRRFDTSGDCAIYAIPMTYKNEAEIISDAIRRNVSHGRALTKHDKAHCLVILERHHLEPTEIASLLNMTTEAVGALQTGRIASTMNSRAPVALKRTISHMAGRRLNKEQQEVNTKLSGMDQKFYVRQLLMLIRSNLLNKDDDALMADLATLQDALDTLGLRVHA